MCVCVCVCVHFILSFMYHVFSARGWSVLAKHVARFGRTIKICCGWWLYVYRFF